MWNPATTSQLLKRLQLVVELHPSLHQRLVDQCHSSALVSEPEGIGPEPLCSTTGGGIFGIVGGRGKSRISG